MKCNVFAISAHGCETGEVSYWRVAARNDKPVTRPTCEPEHGMKASNTEIVLYISYGVSERIRCNEQTDVAIDVRG